MADWKKASTLAQSFKKPNYEEIIAPQTSFRLNVEVYSTLKALSEMYPSRSLNDIVNKLLAAALEDFKSGLRGREVGQRQLPDGSIVEAYEDEEAIAELENRKEAIAKEMVKKIQLNQKRSK